MSERGDGSISDSICRRRRLLHHLQRLVLILPYLEQRKRNTLIFSALLNLYVFVNEWIKDKRERVAWV